MPADALWTFAMACNVYLTFFHSYDTSQLRRLEIKYLLGCYGIPFVTAFVFLFIRSASRGKVYGSALVSNIAVLLEPKLIRATVVVLGFT